MNKILYLFSRTPLHVGAGSSVGAIDQPIQRERHTGFPIIPGSSIKGVLRDHLAALGQEQLDDLFGQGGADDSYSAGKLSFAEARLLLFPVRSAKGAFALATSPLALQRFARDADINISVPDAPNDMACLAGKKLVIDRSGKQGVVLEEYRFAVAGQFPKEWEDKLRSVLSDAVINGAEGRFVLLSDGDLSQHAVVGVEDPPPGDAVRIDIQAREAAALLRGQLVGIGLLDPQTAQAAQHYRREAPAAILLGRAQPVEQRFIFGGRSLVK